MENTARLYNCARCHCQVIICSRCDRGNIYCHRDCALIARANSQREACRRYQSAPHGRLRHAARQRRYRQRQKQKVTHQGSPLNASDDSLPSTSSESDDKDKASLAGRDDAVFCHFCHRRCSLFVRQGYLDGRRHRYSPDVRNIYPAAPPPAFARAGPERH
ncbi:MAG: hypothetical protein GY792_03465 [Gammaproteobacteria bacterium]|nr:hypothetical protein [Gammaproteobacteria bacterium]